MEDKQEIIDTLKEVLINVLKYEDIKDKRRNFTRRIEAILFFLFFIMYTIGIYFGG